MPGSIDTEDAWIRFVAWDYEKSGLAGRWTSNVVLQGATWARGFLSVGLLEPKSSCRILGKLHLIWKRKLLGTDLTQDPRPTG